MEQHHNNKQIRFILVILVIAVFILSTVVIIQSRYINKLKKEMISNFQAANANDPGSNSNSIEMTSDSGDISGYLAKIKKLESRIADMQEWQDYLEETLNNIDQDNPVLPPDVQRNAMNRPGFRDAPSRKEMIRNSISRRYEDLLKDINLSPDMEAKLMDLLLERGDKLAENAPRMRGLRSERIIPEEFLKVQENINAEYDEKIADLLSSEDYAAYKDYEKLEEERQFIKQFKDTVLLGDTPLEKEQEKELIAAMYDDGQKSGLTRETLIRQIVSSGETLDQESLKKQLKNGLEQQDALYDNYIETARNILSESQMKKFETYIGMQKSNIEMMKNNISQISLFPGRGGQPPYPGPKPPL